MKFYIVIGIMLASVLLLAELSSASSASLFKYKLSATSKMQIMNHILKCADEELFSQDSNVTHFDFENFFPSHQFSDNDTLKKCDEAKDFFQCLNYKFDRNTLVEPEAVDRVKQLIHSLQHLQELFCFSNESRAEFRESVQCFRQPQVIFKYIKLKEKYKILRHVLFGDEGFNREIECCLEYARIGEVKKTIMDTCKNFRFAKLAQSLMQELSYGSLLGIYKVCSSNFGMGKYYWQCKSVLPLHIADRLPSAGSSDKQNNKTTTKKPILSKSNVTDSLSRSALNSIDHKRSKDSYSVSIEYELNEEEGDADYDYEDYGNDDDNDDDDENGDDYDYEDYDYNPDEADELAGSQQKPKNRPSSESDNDNDCGSNDDDDACDDE